MSFIACDYQIEVSEGKVWESVILLSLIRGV